MANIKCTAKLVKELGTEQINEVDQPANLFDWHANLLRLNRKKYVLFTNDQTLYSVLVRWTKTLKTAGLLARFRLELFKNLMSEGFLQERIELFLSHHSQISIKKTNNRSVLGSMNDLTFQIEYMIYRHGGLADFDLTEIIRQTNRTPMKAIKYQLAIDEMKRKLNDVRE